MGDREHVSDPSGGAPAPTTADALLATLRAETGVAGLEFAAPPTVLAGGYYAELLRFSLLGAPPELAGDLVGRIVPDAANAAWEGVLQRAVAAQGFPTPAVHVLASGDTPLGRALVVMDHEDGRPLLGDLDLPEIIGEAPALVRRMPDVLARLAAQLHALDPSPVAAELEALDGQIPTTTAGFLLRERDRVAGAGRTDLVAAIDELLRIEPHSPRRVISHGDLHPLNVLVTDQGPVLIDWTVARVAHPGFTLGFTDLMLSNPPVALPRPAAIALRPVFAGMRRRFLRRYAELADPADQVTAAELAWFRKVHQLRILAELATWEAAGTLPDRHPWLVLRAGCERDLGIAPAPVPE